MKRTRLTKGIFTGILVLSMLVVTLTGCNNNKGLDGKGGYSKETASSTKVMMIGDYDIYLDELLLYAIQTLVMDGDTVTAGEDAQESYKLGALTYIRETKILYDVAIHNNVELNDEDLETTNTAIENFKNAVPKEIFDKYGISDEVIEKIFTEQTYVSKFENDIKNEMGKNANEEIAKGYEDYNFNVIYYMLFPTVEINEEDNTPAIDEDGNYINISDKDKKDVLKTAEKAAERIKAGEDAETLAEEYGVTDYSAERSGYIGSYSDSVNDALEGMKNGECTDAIEETLGYAVIVMKSENDEDLKTNYVYLITSDYVDSEFEKLRYTWLATIPVDPVNDMEGTVWEDFSLEYMMDDLSKAGLISK